MTVRHAKWFAAAFGIGALLNAISFDSTPQAEISIVNYGGSVFAIFLYLNPKLLIARSWDEIDRLMEEARAVYIMWIGIAIGFSGVLEGFL